MKLGDQTMVDGMIKDGLWCSFCDVHMGGHAEYTAKKAGVTRSAQDEFALQSHRKAIAAMEAGKFKAEIVPVADPGQEGADGRSADEGPRRDTTLETLAKLRPAFPATRQGHEPSDLTVTAGNASTLNDGAAALVVTSEAYARAHGLTILARITAYATGAGEPQDLFFAPIDGRAEPDGKKARKIGDYDLIEANEAFASQALADGAGARLGLGPRERERRRDRARPSDRRERRARAHDAALRDAGSRTRARGSPRSASAAATPSRSASSACPDRTRGARSRVATAPPDDRAFPTDVPTYQPAAQPQQGVSSMADRVAVVGAGQMGNGIAHVFAQSGFDGDDDRRRRPTRSAQGARRRSRRNLDRQIKKGALAGRRQGRDPRRASRTDDVARRRRRRGARDRSGHREPRLKFRLFGDARRDRGDRDAILATQHQLDLDHRDRRAHAAGRSASSACTS